MVRMYAYLLTEKKQTLILQLTGNKMHGDTMWHDDNDDIMKLYNLLEEHEINDPLPAVCPVCGSKSGHIYLHRYDEEHHGGSWVGSAIVIVILMQALEFRNGGET